MNSKQLQARLGINAQQLKAWCDEGLPHTRRGNAKNGPREFDPAAVREWLIATGKARDEGRGARDEASNQTSSQPTAETIPTVAVTRDEAARLLGVDLRTLARYLKEADFPGRAGSPGRKDGYFPIEAIRAWMLERGFGQAAGRSPVDDALAQRRMSRLDLQIIGEQLDIEQRLGSVCDTEEVARFLERAVATAKAILGDIPDSVDGQLSTRAGPKFRRRLRRLIEAKIADALEALAEVLIGDTDPTDDRDAADD